MSLLSRNGDILLFVSAVFAANGIAIAAWMLLVSGRAGGRRRCRRCWYSMEGAIPDEQGVFTCPEFRRTMPRERDLFRTNRQWRRASVGLLLLLAGTALAGAVVLRDQTLWRFAPDVLIIDAIPRMRSWNDGSAMEFARRRFVEGNNVLDRIVFNGSYKRIDLHRYHLRKLRGFEQRLLARRAAEALEANSSHPFTDDLLIALALSGREKDRAFKIVKGLVQTPSPAALDPLAIALLPLVSPDSKSAASILTARLAALVQNDPQLSDDGDRLSAAWLVDAIGDTGEGGVDAVPLLLAILPYEWPQTFVFVPVVKALGRIGPGAKAALPFLKVSADLSDSSDGDRIDRSVATMLIDGTCRTEEEAFIRMLSHPNWRARRSAAQELGRCRELSNVGEQALVAALEDSDEYVRETAAESLLDNGLEREACHRALLHPVPSNGRASMWAPVQIMWRYDLDPAEAIPSLEEELKTSPYPDGIRDMISRIRRNDPFDNASPKRNGGLR